VLNFMLNLKICQGQTKRVQAVSPALFLKISDS
jgi:hypothetical protein